jgi:hypothetical protein
VESVNGFSVLLCSGSAGDAHAERNGSQAEQMVRHYHIDGRTLRVMVVAARDFHSTKP